MTSEKDLADEDLADEDLADEDLADEDLADKDLADKDLAAELVAAARKAAQNAYAPYSGFRVGAALLADDGRIFSGANVENAAYPSSNCAEATAVAHAASEGMRKIKAAAVACIDAPSLDMAYPCGRCRQILNEFDAEVVYVATGSGEVREHTLKELLPYGFKLEH